MSISDREFEEAGKKLLDPPSSVDQILSILNKVVQSISNVEQSPPHSTMRALSPLIEALVAPKLLRLSDVDVRVAVTACITQITRITAPDITYDDDQMKVRFFYLKEK
ncbi:uncharacterized protein LOC112083982 [Eutrema salsugineum]|uniref:uncharacterized protein LOC112083982 n=1 Tax=Eutrema salsugineum TaxID=72664 RepID=UPI000CED7B4C|nr:uncharacterized protein LOC112083982 [Eutrema salsugineum]